MTLRQTIYLATTLLLFGCQRPIEPQMMVGFVERADNEMLTIANDTAQIKRFLIDENTLLSGGALIEGNIVEIIYLPAQEQAIAPTAQSITADETYSKALGRWSSEQRGQRGQLAIDITLHTHGRISQSQPTQTLQFTRWELSPEQDIITLHGTLSLPPDHTAKAAKSNKEQPSLPQRRPHSFSVEAHLTRESDSNTESRSVMIFQTENGSEAKLYLQSEQ